MKYIRMHQVEAEPMTRGDYNKKRGWEIPANENPADEGYLVTYPDGYISWCPKAQFEAAGRPCDGMTFGMAIESMQRGSKVARKGWRSKGKFLWIKPQVEIQADWCKDPMLKKIAEENGGTILGVGVICLFTPDSLEKPAILDGWTPLQCDMLANDWAIVE